MFFSCVPHWVCGSSTGMPSRSRRIFHDGHRFCRHHRLLRQARQLCFLRTIFLGWIRWTHDTNPECRNPWVFDSSSVWAGITNIKHCTIWIYEYSRCNPTHILKLLSLLYSYFLLKIVALYYISLAFYRAVETYSERIWILEYVILKIDYTTSDLLILLMSCFTKLKQLDLKSYIQYFNLITSLNLKTLNWKTFASRKIKDCMVNDCFKFFSFHILANDRHITRY